MASLSEEMKNKRDVKRKAEVLIVDKDLGNFGLYKAILSAEYILECAYNVAMAKQLCSSRAFDVIVIDGTVGVDSFKELRAELKERYGDNIPELLVMEEPEHKAEIISYMCVGAKGYIPKPFSKDGMIEAIYELLQKRRKKETKHTITIIDTDLAGLKAMKRTLEKRYIVGIINDIEMAKDYVSKKTPDLVIMDVSAMGGKPCICEILAGKEGHSHILFMASSLDEDVISKCSNFNPEGILMKPFADEVLQQTVEKILLRQSYMDDFGKR